MQWLRGKAISRMIGRDFYERQNGFFKGLSAAHEAFEEAITLRERHCLWLDSAETHYILGLWENVRKNTAHVLELCEAGVERCERGLSQLIEQEPRDLFKANMLLLAGGGVEDSTGNIEACLSKNLG